MWQYMAILELGVIRTCFYDAVEECPEKIVYDFYYDCEDDDLHDEWKKEKFGRGRGWLSLLSLIDIKGLD